MFDSKFWLTITKVHFSSPVCYKYLCKDLNLGLDKTDAGCICHVHYIPVAFQVEDTLPDNDNAFSFYGF